MKKTPITSYLKTFQIASSCSFHKKTPEEQANGPGLHS
ncbi:hypothetical protein NC99_46510 [Sunxiuqinia dokdonensis]|uniref:Uncharacterized protein n=1 Tax=Sunxiuqinia dokdonensis TaxID=1409788 RepID=A0A0L8V2F4_9BACT|nr:hypothetical protein NC99_46510 [Sunxiuqinia dokdonensis]